MELKLVLLEDLQGAIVRVLDQLSDNRVHTLGRTGGAGERRVLIEIRVLHGTERHHAKLVGHTKARHHVTGKLGGLFDIASEAGIQRKRQDFGQTLGRWGVPTGPYVVLPLWGPSTVRDTAGMMVDGYGYPANHMEDVRWRNSLYALRVVNTRANYLKAGDTLDSVALDKYSLMRDVYLRSRIGGAASGGAGGCT